LVLAEWLTANDPFTDKIGQRKRSLGTTKVSLVDSVSTRLSALWRIYSVQPYSDPHDIKRVAINHGASPGN
jgi:hypothetical protein